MNLHFFDSVIYPKSENPSNMNSTCGEKRILVRLLSNKKRKAKMADLVVEGDFDISKASEINEKCNGLFDKYDQIVITLKNMYDIDLAAIQLFQTLQTYPSFFQKRITFDA